MASALAERGRRVHHCGLSPNGGRVRQTLCAMSLAREANDLSDPSDSRHLIEHRMADAIQAVDPVA